MLTSGEFLNKLCFNGGYQLLTVGPLGSRYQIMLRVQSSQLTNIGLSFWTYRITIGSPIDPSTLAGNLYQGLQSEPLRAK